MKCIESSSTQSEVHQSEVHRVKCIESSSTQSEVHQCEVHRVKCIGSSSTQSEGHESEEHRANCIESSTQSELHRVKETYLHLGISIFLSIAGTSTDAIDRECNPLRGLAWSSARTRGQVATFRVPAQPSTSVRSHREKYIDDNR